MTCYYYSQKSCKLLLLANRLTALWYLEDTNKKQKTPKTCICVPAYFSVKVFNNLIMILWFLYILLPGIQYYLNAILINSSKVNFNLVFCLHITGNLTSNQFLVLCVICLKVISLRNRNNIQHKTWKTLDWKSVVKNFFFQMIVNNYRGNQERSTRVTVYTQTHKTL